MAKALNKSVVRELIRRGYSAVASEDKTNRKKGFDLTGQTEVLDGSHAPRVAAISWVLLDQDQNEVAFLRQSVQGSRDAWAYGSPSMIKAIGEETAANLSPFLGGPKLMIVEIVQQNQEPAEQIEIVETPIVAPSTVQTTSVPLELLLPAPPLPPPLKLPPAPVALSAEDVAKRPFGLWIDEVTGAPGDGNRSLTYALIDMLAVMELPFARTPGIASHYIQGVVDVVALDATTEHVTIIWVVKGPGGEEIGRVTQRNDIARGTLHQAWRDTANFTAQGGVEGIAAILERDLDIEF